VSNLHRVDPVTARFRTTGTLEHPGDFDDRRNREFAMPAKSKAQQKAAGAALSAKRGETAKSDLKGASKQMVESMSEKQLEELAETKRKKLPNKKS
jgi:hypothetical protein